MAIVRRKGVMLGVGVTLVSCLLVYAYTLCKYETKRFDSQLPGPGELWQHRGDIRSAEQNSIKAFSSALAEGAKGIELDVHYDSKIGRFVVSYKPFPYNRKSGELLYLDDVFTAFGTDTYYWIDYKNLSFKDHKAAKIQLENLVEKHNLEGLVFLESTRGYLLHNFTGENIKTLFLVNLGAGKITAPLRIFLIKCSIAFLKFSAISTDVQQIDSTFLSEFSEFPLFVFTVNNIDQYRELSKISNVRVVLTDDLIVNQSEI